MLSQVVHTSGSTVYFVFVILFFWMSRIPRTEAGPGWWAAAIFSAFIGRLTLLVVSDPDRFGTTLVIYSIFVIVEKFFLLSGLAQFFSLPGHRRWIALCAALAETWIAVCWFAGIAPWIYSIGFAIFNIGAMAYATRVAFAFRADVPHRILTATAIASALLLLHWATFPLIFFSPLWRVLGFVIGTVLVLVLYLSLLAAVFASFQKRLLDAEEKALEMAYQDPLTGLNNKRYMNVLFDKVLMLATRPHHLLAVIFIDLDNFKPINDTAGHRAGDEVLKTVAKRLKQNTRSTDVCARVGGDEFVIIATQLTDERQTVDVAQKILAQMTQEVVVDGVAYALGASIGVSLYPAHGADLSDLMEKADAAMYEVKRGGKSGYRIFGGEPGTRGGDQAAGKSMFP